MIKILKTNKEFIELEKIKNDLILTLFDTRDKRYVIERALNEAFQLGMQHKKETSEVGG